MNTQDPAALPAPHTWSDHDLEQFHDGELAPRHAEALGEALRESPALRERLSEIARLDAAAARALLAEGSSSFFADAGVPLRLLRTVGALAVAACLTLLVIPLVVRRPVAPAPAPIASTPIAAPTPRADAPGIRVVLSLPVIKKLPPIAAASDPSHPGDTLDAAAKALASGDRAARDAELRRLGELIRSAARAEELLDSLSAREQLAACRVWAEDPRLRPAAFARLDRLRSRTEIADQYRAVMTGLSSRPELGAWVRSYIRTDEPDRAGLKSS